jgi:ribosomal protein L16 Arg81 hydroxylase
MSCESRNKISSILSPCPYDSFFNEFVGKKPLILLGDETRVRTHIAGKDPKNDLLQGFEKYAPTLTCHSHAPNIPPPKARPVKSAEEFQSLVSEYHKLGYTVRIPQVTDLSSDLSLFTRSLEEIVENPVGVVVFWSAAGAAAPVHYDEVDVIVIQLVGTKRWFVSEQPSKLPNKWKEAGESPPAFNKYQTVDVGPGDFMYLPRGTVHTVQSTSESLHLSIGFVPITVREGITAVLDHLSDLERSLRMDIGLRSDEVNTEAALPTISAQIKDGIEKLLTHCQTEQFVKDAMSRRRARMIAELPKLSAVRGAQEINLSTYVKHNPLAMIQMIRTSDIIDFCQPGEHILIHKGVEDVMDFIVKTEKFCVADVPGDIADDVRIALVSRLISSAYLLVDK